MTVRVSGTLVRWNDDRGFGFVSPAAGGPDLFAHISAFPEGGRPRAGDALTFLPDVAPDGRPRAAAIAWTNRGRGSTRAAAIAWTNRGRGSTRAATAVVLTIGALGLLALGIGAGLPLWIPALYVVASLITAGVYLRDKRAAVAGRWRVPEGTLLLLGLVGGWPGAFIAQQALRHKTRKSSFGVMFWTTVVLNLSAIGLVAYLAHVAR